MTKILIGEDFCEISGHAPDPVVCHGISAISQMAGNYLERGGLGSMEKGDGYLRITQNRKARQAEGTGILFGAVYCAFMDIAEEYPGNIEIDLAGRIGREIVKQHVGCDPVSPFGARGEASYFCAQTMKA